MYYTYKFTTFYLRVTVSYLTVLIQMHITNGIQAKHSFLQLDMSQTTCFMTDVFR